MPRPVVKPIMGRESMERLLGNDLFELEEDEEIHIHRPQDGHLPQATCWCEPNSITAGYGGTIYFHYAVN